MNAAAGLAGGPEPGLNRPVLARTGEVVDMLLADTHAGRWMAHCNIAEHHESGTVFSFNVEL